MPLRWGVPDLWQQLAPLLPGLSVEVLERVDSTNTVLLERARPHARPSGDTRPGDTRPGDWAPDTFGRRAIDVQPCLLIAEHQSGGRGRLGRAWLSEPGASLTFSLGLTLQPADWSGMSLAVGVALAEALAGPPGGPTLGIKWPNDLWLMDAPGRGRKLGGILIETVTAGPRRLAVIGIGLNVHTLALAEATTGVAGLQELDPALTAPAALARIARPLIDALHLFERAGFQAFAERYAALDVLAGRAVTTTRDDLPEGIARGVDADGSLRLETPAGIVRLTSGEVSVRPAPDR